MKRTLWTALLIAGLTGGLAWAGNDLANGAGCTFNSDCASGNCSFKTCKSKSGGKQLGNGQGCTFGSDCESGNCSFKTCKK